MRNVLKPFPFQFHCLSFILKRFTDITLLLFNMGNHKLC